MNLLKAVKVNALRDVLFKDRPDRRDQVDPAYWIRSTLRWYSKTFSTPLHVVEELPLVDVLRAYYEETFEGMSEDELEDLRIRVTETPEEAAKRLEAQTLQEADDDAFLQEKFLQEMAAKEQIRLKESGKPVGIPGEPLKAVMVSDPEDGVVDLRFVDEDTFEEELRRIDEQDAARKV